MTGRSAFKTIGPEAAVGVLAPVNCCPEAGRTVLRPLDGVDKLGFFHFTGRDAEFPGFLLYLGHRHAFWLLGPYRWHCTAPLKILTV